MTEYAILPAPFGRRGPFLNFYKPNSNIIILQSSPSSSSLPQRAHAAEGDWSENFQKLPSLVYRPRDAQPHNRTERVDSGHRLGGFGVLGYAGDFPVRKVKVKIHHTCEKWGACYVFRYTKQIRVFGLAQTECVGPLCTRLPVCGTQRFIQGPAPPSPIPVT